jgi:hypothetical protein
MKRTKFNLIKVVVYCSDFGNTSIISQLRPYRISLGIQQVEIAKEYPEIFKSGGHVSALEHKRQRESTTQAMTYARALGIKELEMVIEPSI